MTTKRTATAKHPAPSSAPAIPPRLHLGMGIRVVRDDYANDVWDTLWETMGGDIEALQTLGARARVPFSQNADLSQLLPDLLIRGRIIHRGDPTLLFNWCWFPGDAGPMAYGAATQNGWLVATLNDFVVNPILRSIITPDETNRLVVPDMLGKPQAFVLYRTREAWAKSQKELHRVTDSIQQVAEQQANASLDELRAAGMNAKVALHIEDTNAYQPSDHVEPIA
jgi:hypothetical protein